MTSSAPYDPDQRRATPLARKLVDAIGSRGPIGIREYMAACLGDSDHGYYRQRAAIGRSGDFITAPEISQIFGELIGLWCAVVWQQMGMPSHVRLIELGPGRGTLMADALRATRRIAGFAEACDVLLVEIDPVLRRAQEKALAAYGDRIEWTDDLATWIGADTNRHAVPTIVLANEFLDTVPAAQFVRDGADWDERCVALDEEGRLAFSARPADAATVALLRQRFPAGDAGQIVTLPDYRCIAPFFAPLPHAKPAWPALAALFIDYGEPDGGIADTLQAVRSHLYEHPLTSPGEADLSTLVDFGECARLAKDQQFDVDGPVTQAEFLGGLGAIERASRLMHANPAKAGAVEAGLARLLAPQGMGGRFKAIGLRRGLADPLPGLADASAA